MKCLSKKSKSTSSGYSLVELIVVMLLIGLLSAMAAPLFFSTVSKTRLKGAAKEMATTFRYARSLAINTKKPHYLLIDLEKSSYSVSVERNEKSDDSFDDEDSLKSVTPTRTISKEIIISKIKTGSSEIVDDVVKIPFYPQGNSIETIVYLKMRNESESKYKYEIHLDEITGKVTILKK